MAIPADSLVIPSFRMKGLVNPAIQASAGDQEAGRPSTLSKCLRKNINW